MLSFFKKFWFFWGIALVISLAYVFPFAGLVFREYKVLNIGIFIAFLLTGLTLDTSSLMRQLRNYKVLVAALLSSLVIVPVIAYHLAQLFFSAYPDLSIGVLIIGAAPVTVASGTVMTAIAMGNIPLSLFICILGNLFSIVTIPIIVNLLLQFGQIAIELPVLQVLTGLMIKVLLPTVIGQILQPRLKKIIQPIKPVFSIFNQVVVLMIIFNAVSSSTQQILDVGTVLFGVFMFMIALHVLILSMNFMIARTINLDPPSTAAFTIHTSQKTLTISYLVWSGYFAAEFPLALIPGIAYHLTQMIMDTFIAHSFRAQRMENLIDII